MRTDCDGPLLTGGPRRGNGGRNHNGSLDLKALSPDFFSLNNKKRAVETKIKGMTLRQSLWFPRMDMDTGTYHLLCARCATGWR